MPNNGVASPTAVHSWSGFIYQGKIAVYHTLKLLCENRDCNYSVQLEVIEDFSILDHRGNIVSLHQVKAHARGSFASYADSNGKSAFEKLKEHADGKRCAIAFFHLANEISDKTPDEIEAAYSPVKIYRYHDLLKKCEVNQIDRRIEEKIKEFYETHMTAAERHEKVEDSYLQKTRVFLYEIIQEKVSSTHAKAQELPGSLRSVAAKEKVDFSRLLEILHGDLDQPADKRKFYLYKIRQDFRRYYDSFLSNLSHKTDIEKIATYMTIIENLNEQEIVAFIQNITPHRIIKFDSLEEYHDNTLVRDEVEHAFFRVLKELKKANFKKEKNVLVWEINGKRAHYPTTIVHGPSSASTICENIIKNASNTDFELMFENDCLVTVDISVPSILQEVSNIAETEAAVDNRRIMNWKKVSLVSLEDAKREIND